MEAFLNSLGDTLIKVGLFALVQALVYLILSQSSSVFSKTQRSFSFRPARSVSIRRMAAALSDMPAGGELSPCTTPTPTPTPVDSGRSFTRQKSNLQGSD